MIRQLYDYLQTRQDDMVETLRALVEQETPTDNKTAIDEAQAWTRAQFEAIGGVSELIPQVTAGNHQRVSWGKGAGQLLLLTHIDTVHPLGTLAQMPFRREGKLAHGPGIFDMKGGIIIGLYALHALRALNLQPKRTVVLLVTSDEETGSRTSRALIEAEARQSETVIVLEPGVGPQGDFKTWRKGIGSFHLAVTGRASHAGADPERGRSAVVELAHHILQLHALNDLEKGTTLNIGVVTGGTRSNVVAAEASAHIDVRVMTQAEWERLERTVMSLKPVTPDTTVTYTGNLNRPPMERTPAIVARYALAKQLAAHIDYDLKETGTGGGSDGNFTAALGVPTLDGAGAVGNGAHSANEFVLVPMLPKRAALLAALLLEL
jgi:glutamate carboxypeptidase